MGQIVTFRTPGRLDLRGITTFGLNAKPNSDNPIGYFGTGLKYALAVLAREGISVTIWIGEQKWTVQATETTFRNMDFNNVVLVRHRKIMGPQIRNLPFTTEFGKNWTLWMAFRELMANTLDEQGDYFLNSPNYGKTPIPHKSYTLIQIESDDFADIFNNRGDIFIALRGVVPVYSTSDMEIFDAPSDYVFYKGIRVMKLPEPSKYTYNLLRGVTLTEDRVAGNVWEVSQTIAREISTSNSKDLIQNVLRQPKDSYERTLNYEYVFREPSSAFLNTIKSMRRYEDLNPSALKVFKDRQPKPIRKSTSNDWREQLAQAIDEDNTAKITILVSDHKVQLSKLLRKSIKDDEDELEIPF
jgi:hypothetical protein